MEVVKGGLIAKAVMIKELGDNSDNIIVCNAAINVSVDLP